MLLTSFHWISWSDEKQLWCVSDEWQSNLSEHEAVRLLPSVWWIFWDVASVLLHFTAPVLGFTPFSALQTPSSDFITLPVHSGSKHLIPLKHCEKHSLSPQLWPIGKKTYIHLFGRVFHFWIPHCWLKQCSHSSEQTNPFVVEGWKNCPSQFQGSPEKNLLILCDKICATQVTGFKYLNLEEDPHPPHIWAKRTSRASCVRLQQSAPPPAGQLTPHPCTWKV